MNNLKDRGISQGDVGEDLILSLKNRTNIDFRVAIVVAHQDDETIGIGGSAHLLKNPIIIHTTNGSPKNVFYANRAGFETNEEYSIARNIELRKAFAICDNGAIFINGEVGDQEASLNLFYLSTHLAEIFNAERIDVVITQPYEGGHPDHDATAFAVHHACKLMRQKGIAAPPIVEMTCYHADNDSGIVTRAFLQDGEGTLIELKSDDRKRKLSMLNCFFTQNNTLELFKSNLETERFRIAPHYDFTKPPTHILHYERHNWRMTGKRFSQIAANVSAQIEECCPVNPRGQVRSTRAPIRRSQVAMPDQLHREDA